MTAILAALTEDLGAPVDGAAALAGRLDERQRRFVRIAARDLAQHGAHSLVLAGEHLPAAAHALAAVANDALGGVGTTLWYAEPVTFDLGDREQDLQELAAELRDGAVDTLVVVEGNPVYAAPRDLGLGQSIAGVPRTLYLGAYEDETAAACRWYVPAAHYLESWGDARAYDGTVSFVQPLIQPIFDGRTADEVLALFAGVDAEHPHDLLRAFWLGRSTLGAPPAGAPADDDGWDQSLQRGLLPGTTLAPRRPAADRGAAAALLAGVAPPPATGYEVVVRPDPRVYDGRFTPNTWLLELPQPVTKLTWDNAALMSPATAAGLGVRPEQLVRIGAGEQAVELPAFLVPGHADGALTLHLGWGRRAIDEPGGGSASTSRRCAAGARRSCSRGCRWRGCATASACRAPTRSPRRRRTGAWRGARSSWSAPSTSTGASRASPRTIADLCSRSIRRRRAAPRSSGR